MPLFGSPDVKKLEAKRDVQGLVKALANEKHGQLLRASAAEALGRLADARGLEALIVTIEGKDRYVAEAAAHALGHLGDPAAVDPLIHLFREPERFLIGAVDALAEIGDASVMPLIAASKDKNANTARWSAVALGRIGDPRAVPHLIRLLKTGNADVRKAAAAALGDIGDAAVEPLAGALAVGAPAVRAQAAEALGELGSPGGVEPLSAALNDESEEVRKAAAAALGKIGGSGVAEPLMGALDDQSNDVREAAAAALEASGWQPEDTAKGAQHCVVQRQWDRCVEIGGPAVEPLIAALAEQSKDVRKGAAKALGKIGDPRAVDPLLAALGDADMAAGKPFALALSELGWAPDRSAVAAAYWAALGEWEKCSEIGPSAVERLIAALKEQNKQVRKHAAGALGRIADPRAVEPLIKLLASKETCVAAAQALGQIGDPRAIEPLVAVLNSEGLRPKGPSTRDLGDPRARGLRVPVPGEPDDAREAITETLVGMGALAARPLVALLGSWDLRDLVVQALVRIGTPAVEPLTEALLGTKGRAHDMAIRALRELDWSPTATKAGAAYCISTYDWAKCVEIGAPAVELLADELADESWGHRAQAAEALVAIWQTGKLGAAERKILLAERDSITETHTDYNSSSRCSDETYDEHEDSGIGVDFPL